MNWLLWGAVEVLEDRDDVVKGMEVGKEEGSRVLDGFEFEDYVTNHSEC